MTVLAGMPSWRLTDLAEARLISISFFIAILLLSAVGVMLLWNTLCRDFTSLPRLRFRSAMAGTVLWGLLFLLVLTMISGARELLTPGAWEKVGATYVLTEVNTPQPDESEPGITLTDRRERLELLRMMLWSYAAAHDGRFPPSIEESGIDQDLWAQPGFPTVKYGYVDSDGTAGEPQPLVYEFDVYADARQLVLDTSGAVLEQTHKDKVELSAVDGKER